MCGGATKGTYRRIKAAPPKFCHHAFNSGATLLCVGDFSNKIVLHRAAKIILIRGQGLAVKGGITNFSRRDFHIFSQFNVTLEIVIHSFMIRPKQINK